MRVFCANVKCAAIMPKEIAKKALSATLPIDKKNETATLQKYMTTERNFRTEKTKLAIRTLIATSGKRNFVGTFSGDFAGMVENAVSRTVKEILRELTFTATA